MAKVTRSKVLGENKTIINIVGDNMKLYQSRYGSYRTMIDVVIQIYPCHHPMIFWGSPTKPVLGPGYVHVFPISNRYITYDLLLRQAIKQDKSDSIFYILDVRKDEAQINVFL